MADKKFTILDFKRKKEAGDKITMLTAYDRPMAKLIDRAGVDAILVGDSVGMVLLGYEFTARVTMEEMIHHCRAVRRGTRNAFLIGDMPFMSYQAGDKEAVRNAGRFVKEAGCEGVKLEGGHEICSRVEAILSAGIPVLGHIGLTPQSVTKLGGYRVQGRDAESAAHIMKDAVSLERAGCFAMVLECVPAELARRISDKLAIPTIGIGAGRYCDGQVLVTHDMIGYSDGFLPKFAKQYTNVSEKILEAVTKFRQETTSGAFPDDGHSFTS